MKKHPSKPRKGIAEPPEEGIPDLRAVIIKPLSHVPRPNLRKRGLPSHLMTLLFF